MSNQAQNTTVMSNTGLNIDKKINFGIGKRLILAFGGVGALCVLISFVSWYSLQQLNATQKEITAQNVPAISAALSLADQTSRLVASAPLLKSAMNEDERQTQINGINKAIFQANSQINTLKPLLDDEAKSTALTTSLGKITPLIKRLDETVKQVHSLASQRNILSQKLISLRSIAEEKVKPLSSNITFQIVENTDAWYELLSESIEKALTGEEVDPDTSELEEAPLNAVQYQASVLEFKSGANLLIGMLLEGSQSNSIAGVTKLQATFQNSITAMATPLSELAAQNDVKELDALFNELMLMGSRGDVSENILKLRAAELKLKAEGDALLNQARDISGGLSQQVDTIVTSMKKAMDKAVEKNEAMAQKTMMSLVIVAVLSVLVVVLIGWFYVMRNLVKRLMLLVTAMRVIAGGDLSVRVNRNGGDEISLMGAALAVLRNGLRETGLLKQAQEEQRLQAEKEKADNAQKLANEFDMAVGQSLSSLSETVSGIRQKANSMSDISKQTLSETEKVNSASQIMSEDVAVVAASAEQLAASITEISQQVANSTRVAQEAVTRASNLNGNIEQLESGSQKIESVMGLINTIAEQTNLLALNATIEASRAGEAGKGFAVVASEVKNLATQTASAIDNVSKLISGIQHEISEAVEANGHITHIITEIDQVSTGIAAAVEEQSAATAEISRTVQNTAKHVTNISKRVLGVSDAIKSNNTMVDEVLGGVSHIDDQSSSLTDDVEIFLEDVRGTAAA